MSILFRGYQVEVPGRYINRKIYLKPLFFLLSREFEFSKSLCSEALYVCTTNKTCSLCGIQHLFALQTKLYFVQQSSLSASYRYVPQLFKTPVFFFFRRTSVTSCPCGPKICLVFLCSFTGGAEAKRPQKTAGRGEGPATGSKPKNLDPLLYKPSDRGCF
jgi:hypothetical protein